MPIPDFQSIMLPLLQQVADGAVHQNRQVAASLAQEFNLRDEEITQLLPSGQQRVFTNRVAWAKAHLKRAGLLESPSRGTVQISDLGRSVLAERPADIDLRFLKRFPSYDWHQSVTTAEYEIV